MSFDQRHTFINVLEYLKVWNDEKNITASR